MKNLRIIIDLPKITIGALILVIVLLSRGLISNPSSQSSSLTEPKFKENWVQTPKVPTLAPTSTPKLIVKSAKIVVPTIDPDPIINCNIHANCGGGSKQMKRSECSQTTCCQIGDKWYFYLSKTKCQQDQATVYNYSQPTFTSPPTLNLKPPPTFVPSDNSLENPNYTYTPSQEDIDTLIQRRQQRIDDCKNDCAQDVINQINAGFWGDPDAELLDIEYENKQAQIEKIIHQCQAICER